MAPTRKTKSVKRYSNLNEASPGGKNKQRVSLSFFIYWFQALCELLDVLYYYVNCLMFCSTLMHRRETGLTNQDRSGVRESFSDSMKPTGNMGRIGRR